MLDKVTQHGNYPRLNAAATSPTTEETLHLFSLFYRFDVFLKYFFPTFSVFLKHRSSSHWDSLHNKADCSLHGTVSRASILGAALWNLLRTWSASGNSIFSIKFLRSWITMAYKITAVDHTYFFAMGTTSVVNVSPGPLWLAFWS